MPDKPEHDEAKLRRFLGYITEVRSALRMDNWDIILHRTVHEDPDVYAYTWQADNHYTINIELGGGLMDESPEVIRTTVVHELIHAQHRDVGTLWEACTLHNDDVPKAQARAWDTDFHIFMERFVSWTTDRIRASVPLYSPSKKYKTGEGVSLRGEHHN